MFLLYLVMLNMYVSYDPRILLLLNIFQVALVEILNKKFTTKSQNQKLEVTHITTNNRIDQGTVMKSYSGMLYSNKNNSTTAIASTHVHLKNIE